MDAETAEHRRHLVLAEQKSQSDYDKSILTLAGGGLGLSLAFVKDVAGGRHDLPYCILFWCWMCWGLAIASTLVSFYTSRRSLRADILRLDENERRAAAGEELLPWGGKATILTEWLNGFSGIAFLAGVYLIAQFMQQSLGGKG